MDTVTKVLALLAVTIAGGLTAAQAADWIDAAKDTAGPAAVRTWINAAYLTHTVTGGTWEDALATVELRNPDALAAYEVTGTTVTWRFDDACWTATVPTPESPVDPRAC